MQQKIDFLIKISKFLFIFQLIKFFMQHPVAYTTKSFTNKKSPARLGETYSIKELQVNPFSLLNSTTSLYENGHRQDNSPW